MELLQALCASEASLASVDLLPLAEEMVNLQIFCLFSVVSAVIQALMSFTNDARKRRELCNSFWILIGCLHRMTVHILSLVYLSGVK